MSLAPDSKTCKACTTCQSMRLSPSRTEVHADAVPPPFPLMHGVDHLLPHNGPDQLPFVPMSTQLANLMIDPALLLDPNLHVAASSGSLMVPSSSSQLSLALMASDLQLVDVGPLKGNMIFPTQDPCNGLRMSSWAELPGRAGSFVRLREVPNYGAGLAFLPWANHRRMQYPDKYDIVMDFENHTVAGGPYIITLQGPEVLVWCPAKYIWPACVLCGKFLFPCDAHRNSQDHVKHVNWWWPTLKTLQCLDETRRRYLVAFLNKNLRGLANPW
jgi:hypothetical protein